MSIFHGYTKDRNSATVQAVRKWGFLTHPNGDVDIASTQPDGLDMFLQWVWDGLTTCSDIVEEMGRSKGSASKMAAMPIGQGRLKMNGRQ